MSPTTLVQLCTASSSTSIKFKVQNISSVTNMSHSCSEIECPNSASWNISCHVVYTVQVAQKIPFRINIILTRKCSCDIKKSMAEAQMIFLTVISRFGGNTSASVRPNDIPHLFRGGSKGVGTHRVFLECPSILSTKI